MGSASSSMDTMDKKIQMVQLFRRMRGYGRTRYVQIDCVHCVKTIESEFLTI